METTDVPVSTRKAKTESIDGEGLRTKASQAETDDGVGPGRNSYIVEGKVFPGRR